jgi:hypothetical protein
LVFDQGRLEALMLGEADPYVRAQAKEDLFRSAYPRPADIFTVMEFPVQVRTYALVRYEEPNRTDLNSFDVACPWPYIDPVDPAEDDYPPNPPWAETVYSFLLGGICAALGDIPDRGTDLRLLMADIQNNGGSDVYLRAVKPEIVEDLVASKRRELWVRLLAGQMPGVPGFWETKGHNVSDYVVADRLRATALLLDPANLSNTLPIDLLYITGAFSYGNGSGEANNYFNDARNIPEFVSYINAPGVIPLLGFDAKLASSLGAAQVSAADFGSPLQPRIPATIGIGFWIMQDKPQPGSSDFRRWFSQLVDVPAGFSRGMPPNMTRNPG